VYQGVSIGLPINHRVHRIRSNMLMTRLRTRWEPDDFYTKYVQRLVIGDTRLALHLLPLCRNLTSLALILGLTKDDKARIHSLFTSNTLSFPKLRRLYLMWSLLPREQRSFRNPIFQSITHLRIDYGQEIYWSGLSSLENLTHLCLSFKGKRIRNERQLDAALHSIIYVVLPNLPPNLKYFTVQFRSQDAWYTAYNSNTQICSDIETGEYDTRLLLDWSAFLPPQTNLFFVYRDAYDLINSWIYLPRCYNDCWRRAEFEIENRNRIYDLV